MSIQDAQINLRVSPKFREKVKHQAWVNKQTLSEYLKGLVEADIARNGNSPAHDSLSAK